MEQTKTHANTPPQEPLPMQESTTPEDTGAASAAQAAVAAATAVVNPAQTSQGPQTVAGSQEGSCTRDLDSDLEMDMDLGMELESGDDAGGQTAQRANALQSVRAPSDMDDYVQDAREISGLGCVTPSQQSCEKPAKLKRKSIGRSSHTEDNSINVSEQAMQLEAEEDQDMDLDRDVVGKTVLTSERRPSSFNTAISHNNTTIFKPFDSQTGQFLAPSSASTKNDESQDFMDTQGHSSPEASSPPSTTASASTAATTGKSSEKHPTKKPVGTKSEAQGQAQAHTQTHMIPLQQRLHRHKIRSHSVPTILHSSLRKMSNAVQHEIIMNSHAALPPAQLALKHANTSSASLTNASGLIRKKRSLKRDQFSLRNAILMTHRLQTMEGEDIPLNERIKYIKTYPTPVPLPPINLQCLKEIDLSEIVKNPQLRHDIVFDPMLQFRPNLDGERGIKKRQIADKYWSDVENEIYVYNQRPDIFVEGRSRLVPLFNTLKDVLVTIVPQKEISTVSNILDTELLIQELLKGSLVMSNFSDWLSQLFKHHCAPMRDPWVDKMSLKFKEAEENNSISTLVEALRLVFQILEAMKLDIANHQIRILRPALLSNTVDFEKQYFQSLLNSNRVDLRSSLKWFADKYNDACGQGLIESDKPTPIPQLYQLCIRSVISLLSCRKMVKDYPTALSFDHARLILLRADIRQIVCLMVCKLLFKQLVANNTSLDRPMKEYIIKNYTTKRLKEEIVSIITDEHGNCRWTKNTLSIAVQLNTVINQLKAEYLRLHPGASENGNASSSNCPDSSLSSVQTANDSSSTSANVPLDHAKIDFAKSWLSKQTQPLSDVYGVLEARVFKSLEEIVFKFGECSKDGTVKQDFISMCGNNTASATPNNLPNASEESVLSTVFNSPTKSSKNLTSKKELEIKESLAAIDMEEFENSYRHLYTVVNFHWSVFGCHYLEFMGDKVERV